MHIVIDTIFSLNLYYSPLPELWDSFINNDLQAIHAADATAEAEAAEILRQKRAEAIKEAETEKAAVRVLSQKTQTNCSTQLTKKVIAVTAAVMTKFDSTSLTEAVRESRECRNDK